MEISLLSFVEIVFNNLANIFICLVAGNTNKHKCRLHFEGRHCETLETWLKDDIIQRQQGLKGKERLAELAKRLTLLMLVNLNCN